MKKNFFILLCLCFFPVTVFSADKNEFPEMPSTEQLELNDIMQRRNSKFSTGNYFDESLIKMVENENNQAMDSSVQENDKKNNAEIKQKTNSFLKNRKKIYLEMEKKKKKEKEKKNKEKQKKIVSIKELDKASNPKNKEENLDQVKKITGSEHKTDKTIKEKIEQKNNKK